MLVLSTVIFCILRYISNNYLSFFQYDYFQNPATHPQFSDDRKIFMQLNAKNYNGRKDELESDWCSHFKSKILQYTKVDIRTMKLNMIDAKREEKLLKEDFAGTTRAFSDFPWFEKRNYVHKNKKSKSNDDSEGMQPLNENDAQQFSNNFDSEIMADNENNDDYYRGYFVGSESNFDEDDDEQDDDEDDQDSTYIPNFHDDMSYCGISESRPRTQFDNQIRSENKLRPQFDKQKRFYGGFSNVQQMPLLDTHNQRSFGNMNELAPFKLGHSSINSDFSTNRSSFDNTSYFNDKLKNEGWSRSTDVENPRGIRRESTNETGVPFKRPRTEDILNHLQSVKQFGDISYARECKPGERLVDDKSHDIQRSMQSRRNPNSQRRFSDDDFSRTQQNFRSYSGESTSQNLFQRNMRGGNETNIQSRYGSYNQRDMEENNEHIYKGTPPNPKNTKAEATNFKDFFSNFRKGIKDDNINNRSSQSQSSFAREVSNNQDDEPYIPENVWL